MPQGLTLFLRTRPGAAVVGKEFLNREKAIMDARGRPATLPGLRVHVGVSSSELSVFRLWVQSLRSFEPLDVLRSLKPVPRFGAS